MSANNRIGYLQKTVAYTDTTSFEIGYLPPNGYITDIKVLVTTDFTAGVLDVGDSTTANKYADDVSLNGTGSKSVTSTSSWGAVESTADQTLVKGIVVATGTGLAAGSAKVVVEYAYVD
jgi:hypothetical protein